MSHLSSRGRRSHKGLGFSGSLDPSLEWTPFPKRPNWFTVIPKFDQEWIWPVPSIISEQFYIRFVSGGVLKEAPLTSTFSITATLPLHSDNLSLFNKNDLIPLKQKEEEEEEQPMSFIESQAPFSKQETIDPPLFDPVPMVTVAELDAMMETSCILEDDVLSNQRDISMDQDNFPILDTSDTEMKVVEDRKTTFVDSNPHSIKENSHSKDNIKEMHDIFIERQNTFDEENLETTNDDMELNMDLDEAMEAHENRLMSVHDLKDGTHFIMEEEADEEDDEVNEQNEVLQPLDLEFSSENEEEVNGNGEENSEDEEGVEIIVNDRYNNAYLTPHDLAYFDLSPNELEQSFFDENHQHPFTSYPSLAPSKKSKKKQTEMDLYPDEVSVSDEDFIKAFSSSTKELELYMPMSRKAQKQLAKLQRQKFEDVPPFSTETIKTNLKKSDFQTGRNDLAHFDEMIQNFVNDSEDQEMLLDIFPKPLRVQLHALARSYRLKTISHGKGHFKSISLVKTKHTCLPDPTTKFYANRAKLLNLTWDSTIVTKAPKVPKNQTKTVGLNAQPISSDNIGHQILRGLGWQPGTTIGLRSSGIKDPLFATMRKKRLGLGN